MSRHAKASGDVPAPALAQRRAGSPAKRGAPDRAGAAAVSLRGRLWVQMGNAAAFTEPGADLLEQIEACGSLSEAARRLRFSYRRAWMLVDAMNRLWPEPLVHSAVGGLKGGGTQVTESGRQVLSAYRDLQVQLEHLLDQNGRAFRVAAQAGRGGEDSLGEGVSR